MRKITFTFLFILLSIHIRAQSASSQIRNAMTPYVENGEVAGLVTIVAKGEEILSVESFGYRNIVNREKMGSDAVFWIASQSKPIAGVALMMLVDEGKISLDAPITEYLPELAELRVQYMDKNGVTVLCKPESIPTVRQIMSHASGRRFVGYVQEKMGKIDVLPFNLGVYGSAITPLDSDPGTKYLYSNQGINIGAAIIERVSGKGYPEFLKERLFDPLNMPSATFWPSPKKLALAYKKDTNGKLETLEINQLQYPLDDREKRFAEAGGGLFCSPEDLVKFYQMVVNRGMYKGKRYLSEEAIDVMTTSQLEEGAKEPYGIGWKIMKPDVPGHGGSYGTNSRIYKQNGYILMFFMLGRGLKTEEMLQKFLSTAAEAYSIENS
jgi:CubicO group peptidase (beta-lactamase class C family)